jgi:hypothetical protein
MWALSECGQEFLSALRERELSLTDAAVRQKPLDIAKSVRPHIIAIVRVPGDVDANRDQRTASERGQDQNQVRMRINVDDEIRRSESNSLHEIICDGEESISDVLTHWTIWINMVGIGGMEADQFDFSADQPMLTFRVLELRPQLKEDAVLGDGGLQTRA